MYADEENSEGIVKYNEGRDEGDDNNSAAANLQLAQTRCTHAHGWSATLPRPRAELYMRTWTPSPTRC